MLPDLVKVVSVLCCTGQRINGLDHEMGDEIAGCRHHDDITKGVEGALSHAGIFDGLHDDMACSSWASNRGPSALSFFRPPSIQFKCLLVVGPQSF